MDYYELLGISQSSSLEEIKKAYHKLALEFHPDINPDTTDQFNKIKEAYDFLIKNHKPLKKDYLDKAFSEMFSDIFGSTRKNVNLTHTIKVNLSLDEVIKGVKKDLKIKVDMPCTSCNFLTLQECKVCHGLGYIPEEFSETFEFKDIFSQNQEFIFKKVYKDIDLKIIVSIDPLDNMRIKGNYLEIEENLNIFKAIVGGEYFVKTPLGLLKVDLSPRNIHNFNLIIEDSELPWKKIKINFKLFLPEELTSDQLILLNS